MGIAQFVKKLHDRDSDIGGGAVLFRVDPPVKYERYVKPPVGVIGETGYVELESDYVVVSAVFVDQYPETYLFPADHTGKILNWTELDGSFKGRFDIPQALINAGYVIQ